jgi:hypothetical protein
MSLSQRNSFLSACSGKVCVSYELRDDLKRLRNTAVAGIFLASTGFALSAGADILDPVGDVEGEIIIVVGGVDHPQLKALETADVLLHEHTDEADLQLIPTIFEDDDF